MEERNQLLFEIKDPADLSEKYLEARKDDLRRMQKNIYDQTRVAMERWARFHAERISNISFNPRVAWTSVYLLGNGDSARLKDVKDYSLRKPNGEPAQNDNENAEIWEAHFNKVFNNEREVDWSVLNDILQRETLHELDETPSQAEFDAALDGLANDKAPGENGVLPDVIKALTGENETASFTG